LLALGGENTNAWVVCGLQVGEVLDEYATNERHMAPSGSILDQNRFSFDFS